VASRSGPADTRQGVEQRRARHLEAAAHAGLAGATVQRRDDLLHPLRVECGRAPALAAPALGRGQAGYDALAGEGALVLGPFPTVVTSAAISGGKGQGRRLAKACYQLNCSLQCKPGVA